MKPMTRKEYDDLIPMDALHQLIRECEGDEDCIEYMLQEEYEKYLEEVT